MKQRDKLANRDQELRDAIEWLRQNPASHAEIARRLPFKSKSKKPIDRSTVMRWRDLRPSDYASVLDTTKDRIIAAVRFLEEAKVSPIAINFARIPTATEMLPVHLLEYYPDWAAQHGAKVLLHSFQTIADALEALRRGDVDLAIAPRQESIDPPIRRFCEIVTMRVGGLFPRFFDRTFGFDFACCINQLAAKRQAIGCLPNADYGHALRTFLRNYEGLTPPIALVTNHDEAFKLLRAKTITAVLGHPAFIANCQQAIKDDPSASSMPHLRDLVTIAENVLDPVPLDLYLRFDDKHPEVSAKVAVKAIHLLQESIGRISSKGPKVDRTLIAKVNTSLGLSADDKMSGKILLEEYRYEIKGFDTHLLLDLWRD